MTCDFDIAMPRVDAVSESDCVCVGKDVEYEGGNSAALREGQETYINALLQ